MIELAIQISEGEKNIKNRKNSTCKSPKVDVYLVCLMNSKDSWSTHQAKKENVRNEIRAVNGEGGGGHRNQTKHILKP